MNEVFSRKSSVFLSIAVLVASGFLMSAGTASAVAQLPYITSGGHNLYIYPVDNSTSLQWGGYGTAIGAGAHSFDDGSANTTAIVGALSPGIASTTYAAGLCSNLSGEAGLGYDDWYLPAANQLNDMSDLSVSTTSYSGSPIWAAFTNGNYWSSTETSPSFSTSSADMQNIGIGNSSYVLVVAKNTGGYVRCVRSSANPVYTVTYDGNGETGGTVPTDSWAYENGFTVTALGNTGSLVKTDYTFAGWNTANDGSGTTYASSSTFAMGSANVTLYAKWVDITYAITDSTMTRVSGDTTSTVNIDATPVVAGATVTLTVAPKTGMQLQTGTLVASYNDGSPKTLTLSGSGPYTFTMPAYAVTVAATFELVPDNLLTNPGMETGDFTGWTSSIPARTFAQGCPDAAGLTLCILDPRSGSYGVVFSFQWSTLSQEIDLRSKGYSSGYLDSAPYIDIIDFVKGHWFGETSRGNDHYRLKVNLLDASHNVIQTFDTGQQTSTNSWQKIAYTFSDYGPGVRYVYYERSSQDVEYWSGAFGAAFDDASVTIADDPGGYIDDTTDNNSEDNSSDQISSDQIKKAKIDSWSAFEYTDNSSCAQRLELTINGHRFDKDASVFIGSSEASSVSRKSSQKIVAKFCLTKLLDNKASHEKAISVKNPDSDSVKADKKIDLDNLSSKNENVNANNTSAQSSSSGDYDQKTKEGAKQIQEALNKLGYLDAENITSTFGSITMEAVKKFQSDNGIEVTGFVGELTKAKLAEKLK